jgi:hypothetical protein
MYRCRRMAIILCKVIVAEDVVSAVGGIACGLAYCITNLPLHQAVQGGASAGAASVDLWDSKRVKSGPRDQLAPDAS